MHVPVLSRSCLTDIFLLWKAPYPWFSITLLSSSHFFFFFGCFSFPIVYLGRQTIPVFRTQIPAPYQRSLKHFIWHIHGLSQTSQEIFFIVDFCCLLSLLISGLPSSDTNLSISQSISAICKKKQALKNMSAVARGYPFCHEMCNVF